VAGRALSDISEAYAAIIRARRPLSNATDSLVSSLSEAAAGRYPVPYRRGVSLNSVIVRTPRFVGAGARPECGTDLRLIRHQLEVSF